MKIPFKFIVITLFCYTISNAQEILWEKSYGGKHAEYLFDVLATPDYGFVLAGSSISGKTGNKEEANKGDLDYWLWKMDEKGDLDWQKSYGGNGVDMLFSVKITKDAGFILAGTSNSSKSLDKKDESKGGDDIWIVKLNAKGSELWQKTIGGKGQEKVSVVRVLNDGSYIIGGSSASYKTRVATNGQLDPYTKSEDTRGNLDFWIIKMKDDGSIVWQKTLGGKFVDELKDLVVLPNGNILAGGYSNSPKSGDKTEESFGLGDFWLVELNAQGELIWQQTLGAEAEDNLLAMEPTSDGGFIIGGNSNSSTSLVKTKGSRKGSDFWVIKFDKDKNIQWQETYDYGTYDVLSSIVENADGTYLLGGYAQTEQKANKNSKITKNDKEGISDYLALKINAKGEEIWTKSIGSKGEEVMKKLLETRDGGYVLAGTSLGGSSRDKQSNIGGADFWVVKLRDKGKAVKEKLPLEAFPNPVTTFTNVVVGYDYDFGTATLHDINGKQLQQQDLKGERTLPFELASYPIGVYIVAVKTNKEEHSVKIIKN